MPTLTQRQLRSQNAIKRLSAQGQRNLQDARAELARLREDYPDVKVRLLINSSAKRRRGMCTHEDDGSHTLEISGWMMDQPLAEILATLRHEFAHAVTPHAGHGSEWRAVADDLGVPRERNAKNTYLWIAVCPTHGILDGVGWYRRPSSSYLHNRCGQQLRMVDTRQLGNPESLR